MGQHDERSCTAHLVAEPSTVDLKKRRHASSLLMCYDASYPAIHQYAARRTGSPDDTADVISETFGRVR